MPPIKLSHSKRQQEKAVEEEKVAGRSSLAPTIMKRRLQEQPTLATMASFAGTVRNSRLTRPFDSEIPMLGLTPEKTSKPAGCEIHGDKARMSFMAK